MRRGSRDVFLRFCICAFVASDDKANEKSTQIHRQSTPKSIENRPQIDEKSMKNRSGALGGRFGAIGGAPGTLRGRFRSAPGRSRDVLGHPQGPSQDAPRGCWLGRGRSRDVQEYPHGAFGWVFREVWAQTRYFDDFCSIF